MQNSENCACKNFTTNQHLPADIKRDGGEKIRQELYT